MSRVEEKRKGVPVHILMDDNSMFHTIVFIIAVYLKFKTEQFLKNYDKKSWMVTIEIYDDYMMQY